MPEPSFKPNIIKMSLSGVFLHVYKVNRHPMGKVPDYGSGSSMLKHNRPGLVIMGKETRKDMIFMEIGQYR